MPLFYDLPSTNPPIEHHCSVLVEQDSEWAIERIIFDFGGVLIKPNEEKVIAYLAESLGVSADEIQNHDREVNGQEMRKLQWIGIDEEEFQMWVAFANSIDKPIADPNEWREEYSKVKAEALETLPGIVELIRDLKEANYSLDILSNFPEWMQPLIDKLLVDLRSELGYEPFDTIHLSYLTKKNKPDPEAFEGILQTEGSHTVFIDDQVKNIAGAKKCGIRAIHFKSVDQVRQELIHHGVLKK
jgi:putative hydrolase of the HAD superfamily